MKKLIYISFIFIVGLLKAQNFKMFTSAGNQSQYVPVVFQTILPDNGNRTINISRPSIHDNRDWLAHGIASITAIGYGWGSGGNGIRLDNFTYGKETASSSSKTISFVGRVVVDAGANNVIIFLRGGTSYYTDGTVLNNTGSYQDVSGVQNLSAVSINDPLYNLPKGTYYSNYDITAKTVEFTASATGNVGIGINDPQYRLDVNGTIHAKEVKVDLTGWPDYVFKRDYTLPTLEEVEKHIKEKGYLPNVPSEQEVLEKGVNLGDNQKLLLQKIEELTLYSIEQNKKIKQLEQENIQIKSFLKRVERLEKNKN
jgi:hypothetical protein